jgi:hypothetical protein
VPIGALASTVSVPSRPDATKLTPPGRADGALFGALKVPLYEDERVPVETTLKVPPVPASAVWVKGLVKVGAAVRTVNEYVKVPAPPLATSLTVPVMTYVDPGSEPVVEIKPLGEMASPELPPVLAKVTVPVLSSTVICAVAVPESAAATELEVAER